jgi:hypothetical protein
MGAIGLRIGQKISDESALLATEANGAKCTPTDDTPV